MATVISDSGNMVNDYRVVSGFTRVVHATEGRVHIVQGAVEALHVHAGDNLLQYLSTTVQGGMLSMRTTGFVDLRPTQPIEILLTVRSLASIDFHGIGDVTLANLDAGELEVELGGISTAHAFGAVDRQTFTLSALGFGAYVADSLQSNEAHVYVRGQADATVGVSHQLFATITGSGSVYYIGNPTVHATITGSGQVVRIDESQANDIPRNEGRSVASA